MRLSVLRPKALGLLFLLLFGALLPLSAQSGGHGQRRGGTTNGLWIDPSEREFAGAYIDQPTGDLTVGVGQAVAFHGTTDYGTTLTWNFGDGATASGESASHVWSAAGTYSVVFRASASGFYPSTDRRTITVVSGPPTLTSFTATPDVLGAGQPSTLTWSATGASTLSLEAAAPAPAALGMVTGSSFTVNPTVTTTYRLTAANVLGSVSREVTVTVVPPPVIDSFTASPAKIGLGQGSTLSWSVQGATSLSLSPGGPVSGSSLQVTPTATTTYTLTAVNPAGTVTRSLTVTVLTPPVITAFGASPAAIDPGGTSTLSWSVEGPEVSLSISGLGPVTGTALSVAPSATTTYILTATNLAGGASSQATVRIRPRLAWKGDRIFGFGKLLSEDRPAAAGGVETIYVQSDQVGSSNFVTSASGALLTKAKNLAYGERWTQSGTVMAFQRYAGHEDGPEHAVYMQARVYLPFYGRFAQPDPVYARMNLYDYAGQNPVTRWDPDGLEDVVGIPAKVDTTFDSRKYRDVQMGRGKHFLVPVSAQIGDNVYTDLNDKKNSFVGTIVGDITIPASATVEVTDSSESGAWPVTRNWDDSEIELYRQLYAGAATASVRAGVSSTCEDFQLTVLVNFASERGLPVSITTGSGVFSSASSTYSSPQEFLNALKRSAGARDLERDENSVRVSSDGNGNLAQIRGARTGDLMFFRYSDGRTHHVAGITGINNGYLRFIEGQQGVGTSNPSSLAYGGRTVRFGTLDTNNGHIQVDGNELRTNRFQFKQVSVRAWNFMGWNL